MQNDISTKNLTCITANANIMYWHQLLKNFDEPTLLHLTSKHQDYRTETVEISFQLNKKLFHALKELAVKNETSIKAICQLAWGILLARYTNNDDILFGISDSYNQLVPLRINFTTVDNFQLQINEISFQNENLAEQTINFLDYINSLSKIEFNSYFNTGIIFTQDYQNTSIKSLAQNLACVLCLNEQPNSLRGSLQFKESIDNNLQIRQLVKHYLNILKNIIESKITSLHKIEMLMPNELSQIIDDWNHTQKPYPSDKTIPELFEEQVAQTPHRIATSFNKVQLTYLELNQKSNQIANYLQKKGIQTEDKIAVMLEGCIELLPTLLGILKSGATYVPIKPSYPKNRIENMLNHSGVTFIMAQQRFKKSIAGLRCNNLKEIIFADNDKIFANCSVENLKHKPKPENLFCIMHTSGSTGQPKGVECTHTGMVNRLLWMKNKYNITKQDRFLQKTSFTFDVSIWEIFLPIISGARLFIAKSNGNQYSTELVKLIMQHKITVTHFAPSMLQQFLETKNVEACTSLKKVFSSGEALPKNIVTSFFNKLNAELHNLYGPTEASIDVTAYQCSANDRQIPIGKPIDNTQIYILDKHMRPLPVNIPGEIFIGGVGIARGYCNALDQTQLKFIKNPWGSGNLYRTGDIAKWRTDGNIEFLGRVDNQIKLRGVRIELSEVESTLLTHENIQNAIVIAQRSTHGYLELIGYLVKKTNQPIYEDKLFAYLKNSLPCYMIPNKFITVDHIPLTIHGKIDKKALLNLKGVELISSKKMLPPSNKTQTVLRKIVAQTTNRAQHNISINDKLTDIGIFSLSSTKLAHAISSIFKTDIDPVTVITANNIKNLSAIIAKQKRIRN